MRIMSLGSRPIVDKLSTRRACLRFSAAVATVGGLTVPRAGGQAQVAPPLPETLAAGLPRLDGEMRFDDAARRAAAADFGGHVHRRPAAVLRPGSVEDVSRVVAHAGRIGLKLAMRGQGHSLSGQSQVADGVVIDSAPLGAVRLLGRDVLEAEAGALIGDAVRVALTGGLTVPVMPDAMMLSVGGLLSAGGLGETSHRAGALVDHVRELDVVTGSGEFVTCSAEREDELFRMALAGLGQCALIVRARLELAPAPAFLALRTLTYDDLGAFVADQARLAAMNAPATLTGRVTKTPEGGWRLTLIAGDAAIEAGGAPPGPTWLDGLGHRSATAPVMTPYLDYLNRRTAGITAGKAAGRPNPSLNILLPDTAIRGFLERAFASPETLQGIWLVEVSPRRPALFTQPLLRLPAAELAYEVRLQGRASASDALDHRTVLATLTGLLEAGMATGGRVYPPHAPVPSPAQWREHYGPETWTRFAAAKRRFDPTGLLTPGPGIFGA
jgi:FAD/FMN-containing dehydrogenase